MKNIKKLHLLIICIAFIGILPFEVVHCRIRIKSVDVDRQDSNQSVVSIKTKGGDFGNPELTIRDNVVQVVVPNATVWPKIEKKVSFGDKKFDTTLMAYQYNRELVRVRAVLPYSMKGRENEVRMDLKKNEILFIIPKKGMTEQVSYFNQKKKAVKKVENYDENYLQQLLDGSKGVGVAEDVKTKGSLKEEAVSIEDKVSSAFSGTSKGEDSPSKFSFASYVVKFILFLGVVLLLFYLIVGFLKKGVLKKGRLGFLNDTKLVSVLNTTYLAPKKSLVMVKVHKQILLLGSDEKGIHFISEINDVTGLLKEGEKDLAGNNFDSSLTDADTKGKEFKLKEVMMNAGTDNQSQVITPNKSLLKNSGIMDKVKFSDQIKNKVKGLRSLQ